MKWLAAAVVLAALYWYSPPDEPRWRLCPFHWLTGLDCPLCGLTRGLFALAKGRWAEATGFHALTPLAAAMLLATVSAEAPSSGIGRRESSCSPFTA